MLTKKIKILKELSKSGIVALVLISVLGGYLVGHPLEKRLSPSHLLWTLLGVLFLATGSSALNQYQEKILDSKMPRTAQRPLPAHKISSQAALVFISICLALGIFILKKISLPVCLLGLFALFSYNVLYTLWWKKSWAFAAVPGAIPGALPILMGYVAAKENFSSPSDFSRGLYLFFLLFFWQMPHFWALAIKYKKDYAQGGVPTLPVIYGTPATLYHVILWCLAYIAIALGAPLFFKVGSFYLILSLLMCAKLGIELFKFSRSPESKAWLHFFLWINFSLIVFIGALAADLWSITLLPYFI